MLYTMIELLYFFYLRWLEHTCSSPAAPVVSHTHGFDTTALLWSLRSTAAGEPTGISSEERTPCIPVSMYTAAQNKAYGSSSFQWAQARELRRHSQERPAFSVNSNGRFDTFPLNLIPLSFLSCNSCLSHPVLPCFLLQS